MQAEYNSDDVFLSWHPKELGLPRATGISVALVVVIVAFCVWAATALGPKPVQNVIQITQAQTMQLPAPAPPPPPPKVVPPPKPMPVITKPPPVESKIVVPVKPPPPRPVERPVVHTVIHPPVHAVAKPMAHPPVVNAPAVARAAPAPARPAVPNTSGVPIYEAQMHAILQANQDVPPALASLGIGGTAMVAIVVAPDGHVVSAKVVGSSGNPLIDQTALDHAMHAHFSVFNADMPATQDRFVVPVNIEAQDSDSN